MKGVSTLTHVLEITFSTMTNKQINQPSESYPRTEELFCIVYIIGNWGHKCGSDTIYGTLVAFDGNEIPIAA